MTASVAANAAPAARKAAAQAAAAAQPIPQPPAATGDPELDHDSSTNALIRRYRALR